MADELDILRPKTPFAFYKGSAKEFPMPFDLGPRRHSPYMNRTERRKAEREARKAAKKKPR